MTTKTIRVSNYPGVTVQYIAVGNGEGIPVRCFSGLELIDRKDFIRHLAPQSLVDRMVNMTLLTPYHPNGTIKKRRNGKLPNGSTCYDWRQWREIDLNRAYT